MSQTGLFNFLGKCLALGANNETDQETIRLLRQGTVNWDDFTTLASNHLVLPSVYLRFKRFGLLSCLPAGLADHLRMVYELNLKRNTAILAQINGINRLFADSGIVPIYLKGSANLLDNLYEDPGERMIGDIDLLVSDSEFLTAARLLKQEGYEHCHPFWDEDQPLTKHYPRLVHPDETADVEIHRVPVELRFSTHFNYMVINPEKKRIDTEPPCYVLSDRHKVILNFVHGFMAGDVRLMHSVSFRNMIDLFYLSRRGDVYEILGQQVEYAKKALMYADFVNHLLGIHPLRQPSPRSRRFIRKYARLRKSQTRFRLILLTRYLFFRIWSGYFVNAFGVLVSKQRRKSVFRRLSTPSWYRQHVNSYIEIFRKMQ